MSNGHPNVLLGEVLLRSFAHFLIGLFDFLVLTLCKFFINFGYYPLSDVLANMSSHSVGSLFILLMFSFAVQNILV